MALFSDEGDIFDIMGGRYSKTGQVNIGPFLKAHGGDSIRVDRVLRDYDFVERPALTIGLAAQPDVLEGLLNHPTFRGRGLVARFWFSVPTSTVGSRRVDPPAVATEVSRCYQQNVKALLELNGSSLSDDASAHPIKLSRQALGALHEFQCWLEPELGDFGRLAHMNDWASKLPGAVARVAGILHIADRLANHRDVWADIDEQTLRKAISIGEYLLTHAEFVLSQMGTNEATRDAQHLLAWIIRNGESRFVEREAFEGTKGRFKDMSRLRCALRALCERHYISPPRHGQTGKVGRPTSPSYDVNPSALDGVAQFA
jgi:hypothetical protein